MKFQCPSSAHLMGSNNSTTRNFVMRLFQMIFKTWPSLLIDLPLSTFSRRRSISERAIESAEIQTHTSLGRYQRFKSKRSGEVDFLVKRKKNEKGGVDVIICQLSEKKTKGINQIKTIAKEINEEFLYKYSLVEISWYFKISKTEQAKNITREVLA